MEIVLIVVFYLVCCAGPCVPLHPEIKRKMRNRRSICRKEKGTDEASRDEGTDKPGGLGE